MCSASNRDQSFIMSFWHKSAKKKKKTGQRSLALWNKNKNKIQNVDAKYTQFNFKPDLFYFDSPSDF